MTDTLTQSPSPARRVIQSMKWSPTIVLYLLAIVLMTLAVRSQGMDFRAFYVAAQSTAAHLNPYADNRQYGDQFTDVSTESGISRWIYPPPALFFAAPVSWFNFTTAKLIFQLLSIGALIWMLLFLGRRFEIATVWLALACISLPVIACVQRGQIDLLVMFCVVLAFCFSGRYWAGIPLGIAISIKIFPAALLLWWLLERKFKEAATAVVFVVAISLLAAWRFGSSSYVGFLHNLTSLHSQSSLGVPPSSLLSGFALPHLMDPFLSFRSGFVGSYNNPLILFDNAGIAIGIILTAGGIFYLHCRRVPSGVGFFGATLLSQLMNTALWTMGMVMYLPICLIALGRLRSRFAAIIFLIPLYLPSQVRLFGITPRFVIALVVVGWFAFRTRSHDGAATETVAG